MKKALEKKIEDNLGKEASEEVKQEIQKQIEKEVEGKIEEVQKKVEENFDKKVEKEIIKRLGTRIYVETKKSAFLFQKEFKKQIVIAVSAAIGFLIALSWRTPIEQSVDFMIINFGLKGGPIYWEFVSAVLVTLMAVIVLMAVTKWQENDKEK